MSVERGIHRHWWPFPLCLTLVPNHQWLQTAAGSQHQVAQGLKTGSGEGGVTWVLASLTPWHKQPLTLSKMSSHSHAGMLARYSPTSLSCRFRCYSIHPFSVVAVLVWETPTSRHIKYLVSIYNNNIWNLCFFPPAAWYANGLAHTRSLWCVFVRKPATLQRKRGELMIGVTRWF